MSSTEIRYTPCRCCQGPWHEATGHLWDVDYPVCETCYKRFLRWLKMHLRRPWGGLRFYDYAATSIRPPRPGIGRFGYALPNP